MGKVETKLKNIHHAPLVNKSAARRQNHKYHRRGLDLPKGLSKKLTWNGWWTKDPKIRLSLPHDGALTTSAQATTSSPIPQKMKLFLSLNVLFSLSSAIEISQLRGSGTSNPSKCYWSIMETLTEQSSVPVHMTYRSVGSGQGMTEFAAQFSAADPVATGMAVFGSGDIPVSNELFNEITAAGGGMYHLPVLTGAVSFFHSVPDITEETGPLKLNACIISQIYTLDITSWGDDQITALNPDLSMRARQTDISVARRLNGSSSTQSMTEVRSRFRLAYSGAFSHAPCCSFV